jgi:broad specificity phosphatase PhoE
MILYLIRHGLSLANERNLVTGTPDDGLSSTGRGQAAALAAWLSDLSVQPAQFLVSHWERARETAEIVFPNAGWTVDTRMGETDAGSVADMPLEAFREKYPFFHDLPSNAYPGGESHADLDTRVMAWLDERLKRPCRSLAVVTHSGPISCILQRVLGIGMASFPAFLPPPATVSVVRFLPKGDAWKGRIAGFALGPAANVAGILKNVR